MKHFFCTIKDFIEGVCVDAEGQKLKYKKKYLKGHIKKKYVDRHFQSTIHQLPKHAKRLRLKIKDDKEMEML